MNLDAVWMSLPVATLTVDENDAISAINPAAELLMNCSARSMAGEPVIKRLFLNDGPKEIFDRVRQGRTPVVLNDVRIRTSDRSPIEANVHVAPMADDAGKILVCIQSREIEGLLSGGNHLNSAAKTAIGMAEMLTHEIKNPLAGITGAAQLLAMNLPSKDQEMTNLIIDEARRILSLLERVEQFGNVGEPKREPLNIHDLLDRSRKLASVGVASGISIETDYDPSLPLVWVDADQMMQVFLNLLRNAAEAAPDGKGLVRIRTYYDYFLKLHSPDGKGTALPIQVEIIDNGCGVPEEITGNIFEPICQRAGVRNGVGSRPCFKDTWRSRWMDCGGVGTWKNGLPGFPADRREWIGNKSFGRNSTHCGRRRRCQKGAVAGAE